MQACLKERAERIRYSGNDVIFNDFLLVIDVVDEKIEGVDPLLEPLFDPIPL